MPQGIKFTQSTTTDGYYRVTRSSCLVGGNASCLEYCSTAYIFLGINIGSKRYQFSDCVTHPIDGSIYKRCRPILYDRLKENLMSLK